MKHHTKAARRASFRAWASRAAAPAAPEPYLPLAEAMRRICVAARQTARLMCEAWRRLTRAMRRLTPPLTPPPIPA